MLQGLSPIGSFYNMSYRLCICKHTDVFVTFKSNKLHFPSAQQSRESISLHVPGSKQHTVFDTLSRSFYWEADAQTQCCWQSRRTELLDVKGSVWSGLRLLGTRRAGALPCDFPRALWSGHCCWCLRPLRAACSAWRVTSEALHSSSRLYGDESELHFWTVAAHYLHSLSQAKSGDTVVTKEGAPKDRLSNPLDICYDVLCENTYFQVLLPLEKVFTDTTFVLKFSWVS